MSDIESVMKFELLPNETLIECMKYLDASNIFYSFDQLNYRFSRLIRIVPLHLNYHHVRKSVFDQFCKKMLLTPELKMQIRSINLSDDNVCTSITMFLSLFSIDEFSHLRSLTLTKVKDEHIEPLKLTLPFLSELICLCFNHSQSERERNELLSVIPISKLKILSLQTLNPILKSSNEILSIRNLTVPICSFNDLYKLFRCVPMLKILNIENIRRDYDSKREDNCFVSEYTVHLQQLIINGFKERFEFDDLIRLLKQTSNLKSLTICAKDNQDIFDAHRWEDLITTSLLQLINFKFQFITRNNEDIHDTVKQFQSDFWRKQHQWYIEYGLCDTYSAYICTIPYIFNTYKSIISNAMYRRSNEPINNINKFENISDLLLYTHAIKCKSSCYFPNITSLTLTSAHDPHGNRLPEMNYIPFLKMIVNLSTVKHLKLESDSSSVLLQLLTETSQLSSIKINRNCLYSFFKNDELWKYSNKIKFEITGVFDNLNN